MNAPCSEKLSMLQRIIVLKQKKVVLVGESGIGAKWESSLVVL